MGTSHEKDPIAGKRKHRKAKVRRSGQLNIGENSSRQGDTSSNASGFYSRNTGGVKKRHVRSKNKKSDNLAKSNAVLINKIQEQVIDVKNHSTS